MSNTPSQPSEPAVPTTVSLPPVERLLDDHTPPEGGEVAVGADEGAAEGAVSAEEAALLEDLVADAAVVEDGSPPDWGRWRLPAALVPDNLRLQSAVGRLVAQKQRIDAIVREGQLDGLWPASWLGLDGRSIDLGAFVQSVLPFFNDTSPGQATSARVNLKYTLGDDTRWHADRVERPRALAARLAADDRGIPGNRDVAEVLMVAPLGLCVPIRGKARVGFLRRMGAPSMAARVSAVNYPPASQLSLYAVAPGGQAQVWCVLGNRHVRRLEAHWLTVPLLNGYGVAEPKSWPENWPPVESVALAMAEYRGKGVPEVDLVALSQRLTREAMGQRWVTTNLLQLRTWLPRWRYFLASFIGLPMVLLVVAMLALPRPVEAAAVAAILGFAGGAIAALAVPWILARQRDVN